MKLPKLNLGWCPKCHDYFFTDHRHLDQCPKCNTWTSQIIPYNTMLIFDLVINDRWIHAAEKYDKVRDQYGN